MDLEALNIKNLPKQGPCGECDDMVDYHIVHFKDRIHNVKGVEVIADEIVGACDKCGSELWITPLEEYNLKVIYDVYKKKVGLLTTQEIKDIRKKRGMSQKQLSQFLSIGEKDITRYENGSIQTRAVDLMIRMVADDTAYLVMSDVVNKTKSLQAKAE